MSIFIIHLDQISDSFLTEFLEIEAMSQRKLFKSLIKLPSRRVVPITMTSWPAPALLGKMRGWVGGGRSIRRTPPASQAVTRWCFWQSSTWELDKRQLTSIFYLSSGFYYQLQQSTQI